MRNIQVELLREKPMEQRSVEIVERKGLGHPDTICDACCEAASQALSAHYLKEFGAVLHHNLDKGLLIAGRSKPKFGGGKVLEPAKLIIAGRATDGVGKKKIPVQQLATQAATNWLRSLGIEVNKNFKIVINYKPGAASLQEVFKRAKSIALANDTSFGVAHAPLSSTEKLTLEVANLLNSNEASKKFPALGKDIKVMALRQAEKLKLTVASAFIDKYVAGIDEYLELKTQLKEWILKRIKPCKFEPDITINALDAEKPKSEKEIYLTVTGLSAEHGDDGQVGRGNRPCGLIVPCRQMSLEAVAGKNINHPGKLYQVLAWIAAQEIAKLPGVEECTVKLLSKIGFPLDQPQLALIELLTENFEKTKKEAIQIVDQLFDELPKLQLAIAAGKYALF